MAEHFFCLCMKNKEKDMFRLADSISTMNEEEIYLFIIGLGTVLRGYSFGQKKLIKDYDIYINNICKRLQYDKFEEKGI